MTLFFEAIVWLFSLKARHVCIILDLTNFKENVQDKESNDIRMF